VESKRLGRTQDPTILVLTSLTGGPKHGYAIIKDIEEMTGTVFGRAPSTAYSCASKKRASWLHCRRRIVVDRIASRAPARPY